MLKNHFKKKIMISILSLLLIFLISIVPNNKEYEENITYNNNYNYIFLLNKDFLVKTSIISNSNNIDDKIKEIISSLTINSDKKNYINNNYEQIIPENTKLIDYSLDNNLLKLNFSKELLNISLDKEEKMIESIIYSLTELDEIKKIIIFVDGNILLKLPNSNKELPQILTKDYGINKIYDITTISNVNKVTLYYFINIDNKYNTVPVTIFTNNSKNKIEIIIKELKSSLSYQTDLVSFLSSNTKLLDYETLENKIKLNFSTYLLDDFYDDSLIEEVKYALSSSIKDTLNIENVEYYINGKQI